MNCGYLGKCGGIMPIICWPGQPLPLTQVCCCHQTASLTANCGHNDENEGMDGLIVGKLKIIMRTSRQKLSTHPRSGSLPFRHPKLCLLCRLYPCCKLYRSLIDGAYIMWLSGVWVGWAHSEQVVWVWAEVPTWLIRQQTTIWSGTADTARPTPWSPDLSSISWSPETIWLLTSLISSFWLTLSFLLLEYFIQSQTLREEVFDWLLG